MKNRSPHSDGDDPPVVLFRDADSGTCREVALMLEAMGVPSAISQEQSPATEKKWVVWVAEADLPHASGQLQLYLQEDAQAPVRTTKPVAIFSGATESVGVYAAVIVLIGIQTLGAEGNNGWVEIGQVHSERVRDGEVYRLLTALTLHADVGHLGSNLAYGGVFGFMAGRILGGGFAWLAIVAAAGIANGANALARSELHQSIGASTAVFAALGVMVAHALHPRFDARSTLLRRWSPLIGGVLMLAMTGVSSEERVDVGAHVAGFLGGLVFGWGAARLPESLLRNTAAQITAGCVTLGGVLVAWTVAILRM